MGALRYWPRCGRVTILAVRECEECGSRLRGVIPASGLGCTARMRAGSVLADGGAEVTPGTTGAERRREQARPSAEAGSGALRNLAGCAVLRGLMCACPGQRYAAVRVHNIAQGDIACSRPFRQLARITK